MMTQKIHVAVLCGGQSAEHEVSIQSAKNVIEALNPEHYQIAVIFINKQGEWHLLNSPSIILHNPDYQPLPDNFSAERLILKLGNINPLCTLPHLTPLKVDVVFPVLHGAHGEDGTLQGLLELANVPYVGANTLGSAVCMDKEASKHLLQAAGIPVAQGIVVHQHEISELQYDKIIAKFGLPLFIKPANTGSSVGVSKVKNREDFDRAIQLAEQYDAKIIIEEAIAGREIECSVLGNENPQASLPGEIIPHHEFYTYEAKYLDPNGATLNTPAELPSKTIEKIRNLAIKAFKALCCEGMARVDFFLTPEGKIFVNEANTIPGFTNISQYPKMWAVSGLAYPELVDQLIHLAMERFARDRRLAKNMHAPHPLKAALI